MNHLSYKLKKLLFRIWEDFKNPASARFENKTCCSSNPFFPEDDLHPKLIRIIKQHNRNIYLKNNKA